MHKKKQYTHCLEGVTGKNEETRSFVFFSGNDLFLFMSPCSNKISYNPPCNHPDSISSQNHHRVLFVHRLFSPPSQCRPAVQYNRRITSPSYAPTAFRMSGSPHRVYRRSSPIAAAVELLAVGPLPFEQCPPPLHPRPIDAGRSDSAAGDASSVANCPGTIEEFGYGDDGRRPTVIVRRTVQTAPVRQHQQQPDLGLWAL